VSGQQHAPAALYPRERPGTHFTEGWVGPRAGLDGRKISCPQGSIPDCPDSSSSAVLKIPLAATYTDDSSEISANTEHGLMVFTDASE